MRRVRLTLVCVALLVLDVNVAVATAAYNDDKCSDDFNCRTFNENLPNHAPFTDSATGTVGTNTSTYTVVPGEPRNCAPSSGSGSIWGDKSAWVRFDTAVAGTISITTETGFDALVLDYRTSSIVPNPGFGDLHSDDCSAHFSGAPGPGLANKAVAANTSLFVQVLRYCGQATTDPCAGNPAPGGDLKVSFTFTANGQASDQDKDGIPDTVDKCPTMPGPAPTGCPVNDDPDGDGFHGTADKCPIVPGVSPDGCPVVDDDPDHDGFHGAADKCPTQPGIAPDGCPVLRSFSPQPTLLLGIAYVRRRAVSIADLNASDVPIGAKVTVLCHGRGCPFRRRSTTAKHHEITFGQFSKHTLRHEIVTALVTMKGTKGAAKRWDIRRGHRRSQNQGKTSCVAYDTVKPVKCSDL